LIFPTRIWTPKTLKNRKLETDWNISEAGAALTFHAPLFRLLVAPESCLHEWSSIADEQLSVSYGFHTPSPVNSECYALSVYPMQTLPVCSTTAVLTNADVKKGKNVDLYSAYHVLHTSNALSSLNWTARPVSPQPTACTHRLSTAARPPSTAASSSQVSTFRNPLII